MIRLDGVQERADGSIHVAFSDVKSGTDPRSGRSLRFRSRREFLEAVRDCRPNVEEMALLAAADYFRINGGGAFAEQMRQAINFRLEN